MAAPSAKVAIQAFSQSLKLIGLPDLSPELVRQAKFAQGSTQQLWRVLHDAVLLSMLKGEACHSCHQLQPSFAVSKLWDEIAQERLLDIDSDETSTAGIGQEGQDMVCFQLSNWGCCPQLIEHLTSSYVTTRHLLLALVWVVAQNGLLLDAIQRLSIPAHTLMTLPPYAMDARGSPAVHGTYVAAAKTAHEHVQALQAHIQTLQQQAQGALLIQSKKTQGITQTGLQPTMARQRQGTTNCIDSSQTSQEAVSKMWQAADAAANLTASMLGKTRAALLSLQCLMDTVNRLNCEVEELQAAVWPTSHPLSAAELSLLQQPSAALQQRAAMINTAAAALQEQHQLVKGCQLFFLWAASAIDEEAKTRPDATRLVSSQSPMMAGIDATGALAMLAALPPAGSPASEALLSRLQQQAAEAVQKAQHCGSPYIARQPSNPVQLPSVQQFKQLARAALSKKQNSSISSLDNHQTISTMHKASSQDCARPTSNTNCSIAHFSNNPSSMSWDLPPDILLALTGQQQSERQASDIVRDWVTQQALQRLGNALGYTRQHHSKSCDRNQQQQYASSSQNSAMTSADASFETDRLLSLILSVAKLLAQVRGCHRQAIQSTASQLGSQFTMHGIP